MQPGNGKSFLQPVPVVEIKPHADAVMQIAGAGGQALDLAQSGRRGGLDQASGARTRVSRAPEVVYAGYGIVAPEYGWNDYAGLDVRGKLVLALVNDPGYATQDPKLFTGNAMTYYGRWDYKFAEAVRHGAAGLLVIHETEGRRLPVGRAAQRRDEAAVRSAHRRPRTKRLALEGWITEDAAARVLAAAGKDFAALKQASLRARLQGRAHAA